MSISKINKVQIDYFIGAESNTYVGGEATCVYHYDYFVIYGGVPDEEEAKSMVIEWMKEHHKRREIDRFINVYHAPDDYDCPLYGEIFEYPKLTKLYEVHGLGGGDKSTGLNLYGYMSAKNKKQARQMMIELGCDAKLICYIANVGNCICLKYRKPRK